MKKKPKPARPVAAPTAPVVGAPEPIKFKANAIIHGKFISAGSPSPFYDANEVPPILVPFIASGELESEPDDDSPLSATFTLNTLYNVDSNDRRARSVQREVIRLERAQEEQELLEQRLGESNEVERAALEIVQQDHEIAVSRDMAQAAYSAKAADLSDEHAREFTEEGDQVDNADLVVSPRIEGEQRQ